MSMKKIRVLVVDDSTFMRKAIENMLIGEPDIEIVGNGRNGEEAIQLAATLKPDIITLDIEMPKMDGLTALERIMKENPMPIIMVSSLTQEGADTTLKALDMGAVDFIAKEKSYGSTGILKISNELKSKVRRFAGDSSIVNRIHMGIRRTPSPLTTAAPKTSTLQTIARKGRKRIVALGTSTGGPQSLQKVVPFLPADLGVPVLIVQHMPANFTQSLANRLNSLSKLTVVEAQGGEKIEPNYIYIAKGGKQMVVKKSGMERFIELKNEDPSLLHNPSVDVMASSVADAYGSDALGVIMTGMGSDGKKGLTDLKQKGGLIISQDEASSIVYGMPKAVVDAGIADEIVPLDEIAARIAYHCKF